MIANIKKGGTFSGALKYTLDEKKGYEVVAGNVFGDSVEELNREFLDGVRGKSVKNKLFFSSLSLPPNDKKLSNVEWGDIAERYVSAMGLKDCNYIAVKHNDTEHPHIHIIASRIDFYGKTVSDSWDYRKAEDFCRDREIYMDLKRVAPSRESQETALSQNEYQMIKRTQELSIKEVFKQSINIAFEHSSTMTEFINYLEETTAIKPLFNVQGEKVVGISFLNTLSGEAMKGSAIGKRYSFEGLQKDSKTVKGLSYDSQRDDREVKCPSRRTDGKNSQSYDGEPQRGVSRSQRDDSNSQVISKGDNGLSTQKTNSYRDSRDKDRPENHQFGKVGTSTGEIRAESGTSNSRISRSNRETAQADWEGREYSPHDRKEVQYVQSMGKNRTQSDRLNHNVDTTNGNTLVHHSAQIFELMNSAKTHNQEIKFLINDISKEKGSREEAIKKKLEDERQRELERREQERKQREEALLELKRLDNESQEKALRESKQDRGMGMSW